MYVTTDDGALIRANPAQSRHPSYSCIIDRLKLLALEIIDTDETCFVAAGQKFAGGRKFDAADGTHGDFGANPVVNVSRLGVGLHGKSGEEDKGSRSHMTVTAPVVCTY